MGTHTMADDHKDNRRAQPRRTLNGLVDIVDRFDNQSLGRLVNVTTEGLMLVNTVPLMTDMLYQVTLHLPEEINGATSIELGMDCLWTSPTSEDAEMYWSGCHIIDISDEMLKNLYVLIEKLCD